MKHETGRAGTDWLKEFAAEHSFVLFQQCFHLLSAGDEYNAVIQLIWKHCFVLSFNQVFTLTGSCVLLFCLWLSMLTHSGKNETFESNLWNERIPAVTCVISALLFNSVGAFLRELTSFIASSSRKLLSNYKRVHYTEKKYSPLSQAKKSNSSTTM